jgi:Ca-activated chloride channel family protein
VQQAQTAYQKGDYSAAMKEFEADAHHHPQSGTLQFDAGTAAYKAGQYAQATDDFQKSLGAKESSDPRQLAAQEDAYYNLGNTLYRTGQKTEKGNVQQTIQTWESAVKSYDAALELRKADADSRFNRDFVEKKLDELKKQQQQQKQNQNQHAKNQQENQGEGSQAQNDQNQSGKGSQAKNQPNKSSQGSQNQQQTAANQKGQPQSSGNQPPQQQSQASNGQQPKPGQSGNSGQKQNQSTTAQNSPQPPSRQEGQQPQTPQNPGQGSALAQNNAPADQTAHAAERTAPGQMSRQEARQLLDSLRDEQQPMPGAQVARASSDHESDQPIKDW